MNTVEHATVPPGEREFARRVAPSGRTPAVAVPSWVSGEADVPERMLMLSYRVATAVGQSRRQRARLCQRVVRSVVLPQIPGSSPLDPAWWTDPGSRLRAQVLARLRSELSSRVDQADLDTALRSAVLLDELALLPSRQRFALWASVLAHHTTADIGARTGWTPRQVARLLRAALHTVTTRSRI